MLAPAKRMRKISTQRKTSTIGNYMYMYIAISTPTNLRLCVLSTLDLGLRFRVPGAGVHPVIRRPEKISSPLR